MDDARFNELVNKITEAAKACDSIECGCYVCPYKGKCLQWMGRDALQVIREYQEQTEAQKSTQPLGIKGERDEVLMNLYRHFNTLSGAEIIVGKLGPMRETLNAIEKLEHARHMEASDEIAKMSIEKLEKLAAPMPEIRMSEIPNAFRTVFDKCKKKEGAENDD